MGTCGHYKKKDCWLHNPLLLVMALILMATLAMFSAFAADRQALAKGSVPSSSCGCPQKAASSCFMAVYSTSDADISFPLPDPNLPAP